MICGQGRAGKTSFRRSLLGQSYSSQVDSTIGVEMQTASCTVSLRGKKCRWNPVEDEEKQLIHLMTKALQEAGVGRQHSTNTPASGIIRDLEEGKGVGSLRGTKDQVQPRAAAQTSNTSEQLTTSPATSAKAKLNTAKFVEHFNSLEATLGDKDSTMAFIDVMDFAGQEAFTVVQHMLIKNERCGQAVAFDVTKPLDAIADMTISVDGVEHAIVNTEGKTNFDIIEEWLTVLYEAGRGECPLYLIACKIDLISWWKRDAHKKLVRDYLWSNLQGKPYASIVDDIIFVDNTKAGSTFFCRPGSGRVS